MKTRIVILLLAIGCLVLSETVLMADVAKLEWNPGLPATDLTHYEVSWGTTPGTYSKSEKTNCLFCPAPVSPDLVERHCLGSVPRGQTFYFAVQAANIAGLSGYSNEVFKTMSPATNPLGNIEVTGFSANRIDGYDLIALGEKFGASVITNCASDSYYDVNAEKADINYDGRVDAADLVVLAANFGRSS